MIGKDDFMKKIFLLATIFLLTFGSVASAQHKLIRVCDLGVKSFVDKMNDGNIHQVLKRNGVVVELTEPIARPELDDSQSFQGLTVRSSDFRIQGTPTPNGQMRFYVNSEGYVCVAQFINQSDPKISGAVLLMTLEALGLSEQESAPLLQGQGATAETWCAATGRKIIRLIADKEGNNVFLLGASD